MRSNIMILSAALVLTCLVLVMVVSAGFNDPVVAQKADFTTTSNLGCCSPDVVVDFGYKVEKAALVRYLNNFNHVPGCGDCGIDLTVNSHNRPAPVVEVRYMDNFHHVGGCGDCASVVATTRIPIGKVEVTRVLNNFNYVPGCNF
ncbi:MAG: hypothetical protein ACI9P9_000299 [Patescibacteria group bacterium]|jgi:hypothetical protein